MENRELKPLTRVEGEGRVILKLKDGLVEDVYINIFEPPRFFEGILKGRKFSSVMDITARICGICPIAYQMSSVQAIESIFGVKVSSEIENLRRLFYYSEWISSHVLHIFFLHLPDFLGVSSIFDIHRVNPEVVRRVLRLKEYGAKLTELIGGRSSHPVSVVVGGFSKVPRKEDFTELLGDFDKVYEDAIFLFEYLANLNYPEYSLGEEVLFVSLIDGDNYPILKDEIYSSDGFVVSKDEFSDYFVEYELPYSNAKFCKRKDGRRYIVGPLARFNNCFEKLLDSVKQLALKHRVTPPVMNPYKSILVRMLEVIDCLERGRSVMERYRDITKPVVDYRVVAGVGTGISEAPRGVLWHRYRLNSDGLVEEADIVPPTSQNQYVMELDVRRCLAGKTEKESLEKVEEAEKLIRNYDPCISCATHFLRVEVIS